MRIEEHELGEKVKLFYQGEQKYWETTVKEIPGKPSKGYLLCEPVYHEQSCLRFSKPNLIAEIKQSDRIYRYPIRKNGNFTYKEETYLALFSDKDASPLNRRKEFRVPFLQEGELQIGAQNKKYLCYLNNISPSGVGLSIQKQESLSLQTGDEISLSFYYAEGGKQMHTRGTIVRVNDSEFRFDTLVVGVRLLPEYRTGLWYALFAKEQRKMLRRT